MAATMQIRSALLALVSTTACLSTGCYNFEQRTPPDNIGRFEYVYDQRLPEALEDFFVTCNPTYHFTPGDRAVPVTLPPPNGSSCANQLSSGAGLLFPRLSNTIDLNPWSDSSLSSGRFTDYGLWGHPNAYVVYDLDISYNDFTLQPVSAEWVEPSPGEAALRVRFLFPPQGDIVDLAFASPRCRTGCTSFSPPVCNHIGEVDCQAGLDALPPAVSMYFGDTQLDMLFFFDASSGGPGLSVRTEAKFTRPPRFNWNARTTAPNGWRSAMGGFEEHVRNVRWENDAMGVMLSRFAWALRPIGEEIRDLIATPVRANETVTGVATDSEANEMKLYCVGPVPDPINKE